MSSRSHNVVQALDRLRESLHSDPDGAAPSHNVVQALDRLREALVPPCCCVGYRFPNLVQGPFETVLAFHDADRIRLADADTKNPYFTSIGKLTDLTGCPIPGSRVETSFPLDPKLLPQLYTYPKPQSKPFTKPPVDAKNADGVGYSKQAYFFDDDDFFVTVGPSLPKILLLKNGGAQFYVGSIGVISQGGGEFEGVRGVASYTGSAYFPKFPEKPEEQFALLAQGFDANVDIVAKFVPKDVLK